MVKGGEEEIEAQARKHEKNAIPANTTDRPTYRLVAGPRYVSTTFTPPNQTRPSASKSDGFLFQRELHGGCAMRPFASAYPHPQSTHTERDKSAVAPVSLPMGMPETAQVRILGLWAYTARRKEHIVYPLCGNAIRNGAYLRVRERSRHCMAPDSLKVLVMPWFRDPT